jgi:hydroxymethylpyrimidine pyrophosphatase-like HAD family hydrolase
VPRIRLVAIDLDGTLLRSDHTISDRSRSAIRAAREAGIGVTVVTARSPRSVRHIAREAGLNGLAICANGAAVFDLDEGRIDLHTPLGRTSRNGSSPTCAASCPDHVTDVGMLRWAGLGVAPANPHPSAQAAADEITASNDDDGVAMVLERIVSRAAASRSAQTRR